MKLPGYRNGSAGGVFWAPSANWAEDLLAVKDFRVTTVKGTSWPVHPRVDPSGTEGNAQRIVRGTDMAWENAVLSANQNDVQPRLIDRAASLASIPAPAPREATSSRS